MLVATIAAVTIGFTGCGEDTKSKPAQKSDPVGEQKLVGQGKEKNNKDMKGRTMPAPPPVEPIK